MRSNPLGDIRAERDHDMLDKAFYETPEYRSLIEEYRRRIVVGRRGTGKSALHYKLLQQWESLSKTAIIVLTPTDTEIIGLRSFISLFGDKESYLRSACGLAWQYAILNEIQLSLATNYKIKQQHKHIIEANAMIWRGRGDSITARLFNALKEKIDIELPAEHRIATLASVLEIKELLRITQEVIDSTKFSIQITADKLDDGYEPDDIGVAILTGLLYAFDKLSSALPTTAATIFLRDNIFRAIQIKDPDFSRNIEGDILRLHWDEYHLFNMICNRIRSVFNVTQEKNLRVWDAVTDRQLSGKSGFRRCLRLTLYRPRDLLVLMNKAFNHALAHQQHKLVDGDIDAAAREISCSRLDDLKKEYRAVIPGIEFCIDFFVGSQAKLTLENILQLVRSAMDSDEVECSQLQTFEILKKPEEIIRCLYSVGFIGLWKGSSGSFIFCHDGKDPDFLINDASVFLVHPCYWIALNLVEEKMEIEVLEEIHDEYDIEVSSETPVIRKNKLGQFIAELGTISTGNADAALFEEWCLKATKILFAAGLVNVELNPNKNKTQRRDIVGRNNGKTETWSRILDDYKSRQVIFEVKNFDSDLGADEFRQMLSYMTGNYGNLGFIINRSKDHVPTKGKELDWIREVYHEHNGRVIIKLTAKLLESWLSKLRNPEKYDIADKRLGSLLDTYERMYLKLGGNRTPKKSKVKKIKGVPSKYVGASQSLEKS